MVDQQYDGVLGVDHPLVDLVGFGHGNLLINEDYDSDFFSVYSVMSRRQNVEGEV
jgi:hypothetical protein